MVGLLLLIMLASILVALIEGHGALVNPPSRNRIDYVLPWNARTPAPSSCGCANTTMNGSANATSLDGCDNAQACYWYNQGCSIGCECDHVSGRVQIDICGKGKEPTINSPDLRTVNRAVEAGSSLDIYRHNPWRAPGSAILGDECGFAGGTPWGENEWGEYVPTPFAVHGDRGSNLPEQPSSTVWSIGGEAEVVWQSIANHGGGYLYRLCPADEQLSAECFAKTPLDFVQGKQRLRFSTGEDLEIGGKYVNEGTLPAGSTWAMNPVPPRCLGGGCSADNVCRPCPGTPDSDCTNCDNTPDPSFQPPCEEGERPGLCSGNQPTAWGAVAVVDTVRVPLGLAPGHYVLGWRLDCEATAQVWPVTAAQRVSTSAPRATSAS